jgi:Alpha/beta hydrolase
MPVDNRPGIDDPCLNFNTNPASTQMLIEYTCHRDGTSTEEHWAPQETFWTPPVTIVTTTTTTTTPVVVSGGTTSTPTTTPGGLPTGTHTIENGTITPFEQFINGNLTCITADGGSYKMLPEPADCLDFKPIQTAGGFRFQHVLEPSACITRSTAYTVTKGTCTDNNSIWNDEYAIDGLRLALRPMQPGTTQTNYTQCINVNPTGGLFVDLNCTKPTGTDLPDTQLWLDGKAPAQTRPTFSSISPTYNGVSDSQAFKQMMRSCIANAGSASPIPDLKAKVQERGSCLYGATMEGAGGAIEISANSIDAPAIVIYLGATGSNISNWNLIVSRSNVLKNPLLGNVAYQWFDAPQGVLDAPRYSPSRESGRQLAWFITMLQNSGKKVTLIGHSWGGLVANEAVKQGALPDGLVLMGSLASPGAFLTVPSMLNFHSANDATETIARAIAPSYRSPLKAGNKGGLLTYDSNAECSWLTYCSVGVVAPNVAHSYMDDKPVQDKVVTYAITR